EPSDEVQMVKVIGLEADRVEQLCKAVGEVWPASIDGDREVILRGVQRSLSRLAPRLRAEGAGQVILLMGNGWLHTPRMKEAEGVLRSVVERLTIRQPELTVVSSTSGQPEAQPERWRELLVSEL